MLGDMSSRIEVLYRVQSDAKSIAARAKAIAVEQSVEMPVEPIDDPYVLSEIVGRVDDIKDIGGGRFEVRIALASITTGFEAGQLLNMIIGNTSMQEDVTLIDARFPGEFADGFGGPRHGLAGLRARVKAKGALTCSALKPQGSTVAALAKLAGRIAAGGSDCLKDDHGIADQSYSPFAERVPAIAAAVADWCGSGRLAAAAPGASSEPSGPPETAGPPGTVWPSESAGSADPAGSAEPVASVVGRSETPT